MAVSGVYIINLDRRPDRYARVVLTLNNSDLEEVPVTRVSAVDGSKLDIAKYLTPRAQFELEDLRVTGKRKFHAQLTKGAVGCALSHINVWKSIAEAKDVPKDALFLVLEDDASVPMHASKLIDVGMHYVSRYGNTDKPFLLLLHIICLEGCHQLVPNFFVNPSTFWSLQAYVLNQATAKELIEQPLVPMENQLDSELVYISKRGVLNIYGYHSFISASKDTDIQIGTVRNAPYHRNTYHVQLTEIMDKATNNQTGGDTDTKSDTLSPGAIAGIVIGCVAVITLIAAVAVIAYRKSPARTLGSGR